jgi:dephospho-CoA kinase
VTQQRRWTLGGGLASGKSAVRRLLSEAGVVTIDADRVGHDVLAPNGPAFDQVADRWPQTVESGAIDRGRLAEIVFSDPTQLKILESITHPHIFDRIRGAVEQFDGAVVVEIPVITRELGEGWRSIVVDSRDEVRLERARSKGMSKRDALARMRSQPSRATWLAQADVVIPNHDSVESLEEAVNQAAAHL